MGPSGLVRFITNGLLPKIDQLHQDTKVPSINDCQGGAFGLERDLNEFCAKQ